MNKYYKAHMASEMLISLLLKKKKPHSDETCFAKFAAVTFEVLLPEHKQREKK